YRGAAPINWAIINGEKVSGVTTFKLTHEIDTGNILLQRKVDIDHKETAGGLHDKLMIAGAELLIETIDGLIAGKIHEQPQSMVEGKVTHAPKIFTETCNIDWNKCCEEIYNLIRGLSPFPGAFTQLQGKIFKIYRAEKYCTLNYPMPGTLETDYKSYMRFGCSDGYIYAKEIQAEGKKRMLIEEFLRGFRQNNTHGV
ncbi:MAG: methionyl-tRNA formyltransferase, partial [Chitinophagaceae bacterium]|nr:methionyl-tRNA formyltransferase [Chitinophagaceae bacterium]